MGAGYFAIKAWWLLHTSPLCWERYISRLNHLYSTLWSGSLLAHAGRTGAARGGASGRLPCGDPPALFGRRSFERPARHSAPFCRRRRRRWASVPLCGGRRHRPSRRGLEWRWHRVCLQWVEHRQGTAAAPCSCLPHGLDLYPRSDWLGHTLGMASIALRRGLRPPAGTDSRVDLVGSLVTGRTCQEEDLLQTR